MLSGFGFYKGSKGPVESIVGKYDKLKEGSSGESAGYAAKKRQSLINIFGRTYIPNLKHQVELGMIQMVYNEEESILLSLLNFVRAVCFSET